jgi:hypothetical protein
MNHATAVLVPPRKPVPVLDQNDHQGLPVASSPDRFRLEGRVDRRAWGKTADGSVETFDRCGTGRVAPWHLFSGASRQYGHFSVYLDVE